MPITETTTTAQLHDALADQGARLMVETLGLIAAGKPPIPQKQPEAGTTYAAMLTKEDGKIDWAKSAAEIERQWRALHPWPGVWCLHQGQRLKVLEIVIEKSMQMSGQPGQILDRRLTVACGEDAVLLKTVQPQDRKAMDGASFMNGAHLNAGDFM